MDTDRRTSPTSTTQLRCPDGSVVTGVGGREAWDDESVSLLYLLCRAMDD